jgi:isocitrate dehydrogenase
MLFFTRIIFRAFLFRNILSREDYHMAANPQSLRISVMPPPPAPAVAVSPARVTYAAGDGIGPEIMEAVLRVLEAAGASLRLDEIRVGRAVYESGVTSGIPAGAWDALRRSRVFLKAPITTPQGGGYKSLNVTLRKALGLYANVRPCASYDPVVPSMHAGMDVVIVRENEEDTYAGIEHRHTAEVVQCLKLVSAPGSERVVRYAFEYALANGRRKVTCLTKDNIMKLTDGLFRQVFERVAAEYPTIESGHQIIDIGTAQVAAKPQRFDVIVTPNLYGDILSDVAAEVSGSVGMAPSANVGTDFAMFEAVHGSAPDIAGRDLANPSGLLRAAVMMLDHLGQPEAATRIHNAWLRVLELGLHTADIYRAGSSARRVGTQEFATAVIGELGDMPERLRAVQYGGRSATLAAPGAGTPLARPRKELVGVDVFLDWDLEGRDPQRLGESLLPLAGNLVDLRMITNRGVKVWPEGLPETYRTDHWRCRFVRRDTSAALPRHAIEDLLARLSLAGLDYVKTENLYHFDGQPGYSLGQGE